jgi:hypothetical protein
MTPKHEPNGFDRLLHPANAFAHPMDVVEDADLTLTEKRALLASWASDTVDTSPALFDGVMDALKELDRRFSGLRPVPRYRRILERRVPGTFGRPDDSHPSSPQS